jgi:heptaprenyl diphosphate synthase
MKSKQVSRYALLIALAMVLSWLESLVPISAAVPGMKLGLTNLVVIFALYRMRSVDAAIISFVRVLLVSFTFGNAYAFAYSMAGAVLSLLIMLALKKSGRFSTVGVSIAGGVGHNLGQIIVAALVLETEKIFFYLPVLMVSGMAAGVCIGLLGGIITERLKKI